MEGFKVKYVFFFMIVLVLSVASIAALGVDYEAKAGIVYDQWKDTCGNVVSDKNTNIALIPETEWENANQCSYETFACNSCGTNSFSIIVVGYTTGPDARTIFLSDDQFSAVSGIPEDENWVVSGTATSDPYEEQRLLDSITVTYTHQAY